MMDKTFNVDGLSGDEDRVWREYDAKLEALYADQAISDREYSAQLRRTLAERQDALDKCIGFVVDFDDRLSLPI